MDATNANPPPAAEIPVPPVPPPDSSPAPELAAPPAAALVVNGALRSEREIQLERDLETERTARRKAEFDAAEAERVKQELLAQTQRAPDARPVPPKPRRFGTIPIFTTD